MAAIEYRTTAAKTGFSFASVWGAIAAWNDARMTRNSLNKLSARELDDIGLARCDIEEIATGRTTR